MSNAENTAGAVLKTNMLYKDGTDSVAFGYVGIILFIYRIFTGFIQAFPQTASSGAVVNCIVSTILMLVIVRLTMTCVRYVGEINLLRLCHKNFGGFVQGLIGIIAVLYAIISVSEAVLEFSEITKVIAFKTAPIWFLIMFFAFIIFMAQRSRINSILGVFSVITPIVLILFALVVITSLRYGDVKNLFPVLGNGASSLIGRGSKTLSLYSDFIFLLLCMSMNNENSQVKRVTRVVEVSAVVGGIVNILAVLIFTLCASYPFSKDIANPLYHVIEIVYYGRFFQRIDGFYMLLSILVGMLYIAYLSNVLINVSGQLLKISNTKPLSLLYPIVIAVLSYSLSDKSVYERFAVYRLNYSYIIGLILPCALMIAAALTYNEKQKKRKTK